MDALDLSEYLALSTLTLATTNALGEPHAAPVYFAADPLLRLYYFSAAGSRHAQDIAWSSKAAAAMYPTCFSWTEIRGLQLHGLVRQVQPGLAWESAWSCYLAKFPFVVELKLVVQRNSMYEFTPTWARLVDNRQGFGFKQEWNLG